MTYGAIKDGTGNGYAAEVSSDNKLRVRAIIESSIDHASERGEAFNINTGEIVITADSAILFFKNLEDAPMFIDAVAVGITNGNESDIQKITVLRNPTTGTIISNAVAADIVVNRNFGSSKLPDNSLTYKGVSGDTFTNGDNAALFFQQDNNRLYADVSFYLPKNSSIGIKIDVNLSVGAIGVYGALVCHQKEIV